MGLERIEQFIEHQKELELLQKEVLDKTMYVLQETLAHSSKLWWLNISFVAYLPYKTLV
jgi:hypothetical protein